MIEKLQGRGDRKVVHFDRLKLCPKNIRLDGDQPTQTEPPDLTRRFAATRETICGT